MTANINTRKITVLRTAKLYIQRNRQTFVCHAIRQAAGVEREMAIGIDLREYIQRTIHPYSTLGTWLKHHQPNTKQSERAMRQYRIQWIDWMIASLQSPK